MKYGGSNSETKTLTKSKKYSFGKSLKSYICMYLQTRTLSVLDISKKKKTLCWSLAAFSACRIILDWSVVKHVHFLLDILKAKHNINILAVYIGCILFISCTSICFCFTYVYLLVFLFFSLLFWKEVFVWFWVILRL